MKRAITVSMVAYVFMKEANWLATVQLILWVSAVTLKILVYPIPAQTVQVITNPNLALYHFVSFIFDYSLNNISACEGINSTHYICVEPSFLSSS